MHGKKSYTSFLAFLGIVLVFGVLIFQNQKEQEDPVPSLSDVLKTAESEANPPVVQSKVSVPPKPVPQEPLEPQYAADGSPIVFFTSNGFSPAIVKVKAGKSVHFINKSTQGMWVASNNHPIHDIYSGFDQGRTVGNGESFEFIFLNVGTWGYHNHVAPAYKGIVIVEE